MKKGGIDIGTQTLLWGIVLGVAALVRLVALGWPPLNDVEASAALSAAKGALASPFWTGGSGSWASAAYQSLTGWLFQAAGTGDAAARWIPALAGLLLIGLSWKLHHQIGRVRALLLGLVLACSPTLLSISRTAGGASLAVLGVAILAAFAMDAPGGGSPRFAWMGVGLGIALASGSAAWNGLISMAVAWTWLRWGPGHSVSAKPAVPEGAWRTLGLALAVTFLGLTTQFGAAMQGLGVALQAPGQWLSGWIQPGGLALLTGVVLLPAYEPLVLTFGILGTVRRSEHHPIWTGARVWAVTAALLFLFRTGRDPADLVWVVLPLALLATRPVGRLVSILTDGMEDLSVYLMTGLLAALAGFTYLQMAGYINEVNVGGSPELVTLGLVLTALGFAASLFLLYGMTWSWTEAFHAIGAVGALVLALLTLSAGWRLAFSPQTTGGPELWRESVASPDIRLLERTLAQVSMATRGEENGLPVQVQTPLPPTLAWILRNETPAPAVTGVTDPPPAILLPFTDQQPSLPGPYLGQKFGVTSAWGWEGPLPPDGMGWWILRKGGTRSFEWVLYVYNDAPSQSQGGGDNSDGSPSS